MFPSPRYLAARDNLWKALSAVRDYLTAKALSASGYEKELAALTNDATDEQKIKDRIAALILLYALWAYEDGLQESGADPAAISGANGQTQSAVATWAAQQTTFSAGLAEAMVQNTTVQATPIGSPLPPPLSGGTGAGPGYANPIGASVMTAEMKQASAAGTLNRIGMWGESLRAFRLDGLVKGAELGGDDPICQWMLGNTEVHCENGKGTIGCLELSLQAPQRLSDFVTAGLIPRAPGNEAITCGGWKCDCKLVRVADGKQIM